MALQPSDRFAGSQHTLRFNGVVTVGNALATFPKANGEITSGGAVGDVRAMRFLLGDVSALPASLLNTEKKFPLHVYDDTQPAGAAPHAFFATGLTALVVNAGEEDISDRTWAQNTFITIKGLSANIVSVSTEDAIFVMDTLTSGLGLDTGLPVLVVPVVLSGGAVAEVTVDIMIEIRWVPHR